MNVSVTLGERQFNITQKGYGRLESLLANLTASVPESMRSFVSNDAETRLGDYFSSKLSSETVITDIEVDAAFESLGLGSKSRKEQKQTENENTRDEEVRDEDFTADSEQNNGSPSSASDSGNSDSEHKEDSPNNKQRRLHKSSSDKVLAGVCGGLGEYVDIDAVWVRIFVVLATLLLQQLWIPVVYAALWIILPIDSGTENKGVSFDDGNSGGCSKGCLITAIIVFAIMFLFMSLIGWGVLGCLFDVIIP